MRLPIVLLIVLGLPPALPAAGRAQGNPPIGQPGTQAGEQAAAVRAELDKLRQEFQALREQYDQRFTALETRLATIERPPSGAPAAPAPAAAAPAAAPVPQSTGGTGEPGATSGQSLPVYGNATAWSKIFNPDIAVVGDFLGTAGKNPIETGPAFELHEAEVSYQAVVDPYAKADFFFSFANGGVEIEEGFLSFTHLPGGLLARVGEMRGAFGKVGVMHTHVLPWADRPLVIRNLAGGEDGIKDAGVSVARLVPNPWVFLEATGQVFRGTSEVFQAWDRSDLSFIGRLRGYRDLTESSNIDLGASFAYGNNDVAPGLKTQLYGVDATFRYRPLRRAISRQFIARSEFIWNRRDLESEQARSFGFFASADYRFARRWSAGARYDQSGRPDSGLLVDKGTALLLTYWPSEFSQVRGQWRWTRYAENVKANEFMVQFLFSIGAHGAHPF